MPIPRKLYSVVSGTDTSFAQSFAANRYVDYNKSGFTCSPFTIIPYYEIQAPQYTTYAGTAAFYSQDPFAIFTNVNNVPLRYIFSSGLSSLSSSTSYYQFNIYKLPWNVYSLFSDNQLGNTQTVTDTVTSNGPNGTTTQRQMQSPNMVQAGSNAVPVRQSLPFTPLTQQDINTIESYLLSPVTSMTVSTSAITSNVFDLIVPQYVKSSGQYKQSFFDDKSQYFIDVQLIYASELNKGYVDYYTLGKNNQLIPTQWNDVSTSIITSSSGTSITQGPFSGVSVSASTFFTYFQTPKKPFIVYPTMLSGQMTSHTLEIRFTEVGNDSTEFYFAQVNYDIHDTGFTGQQVYSYTLYDSDVIKSMITNNTVLWPSNTQTQSTLVSASVGIFPGSMPFLWRIANARQLIDIFNIRRVIYVFSDSYLLTSQTNDVQVYTNTEGDSKFIGVPFPPGPPPSLDYYSASTLSMLSGVCTGIGGPYTSSTIISNAEVVLTYPNNTTASTLSDAFGKYSFSGLGTGNTYNINAYDFPDSAQFQVNNIIVTGNTIQNIPFTVLSYISGWTQIPSGPIGCDVKLTFPDLSFKSINPTILDPNTGQYVYFFSGLSAGAYTIFSSYMDTYDAGPYSVIITANINNYNLTLQ